MNPILAALLILLGAAFVVFVVSFLWAVVAVWRDSRAEAVDDEDEDAEPEPLGPLRYVACQAAPGDLVAVRAVGIGERAALVLEARVSDESAKIVLTPTLARQFAAGMLDAADEADGESPLLWAIRSDGATA